MQHHRTKEEEENRERKKKKMRGGGGGGGGEVTRREGEETEIAEPRKMVRESEDKIWSYGKPVKLGLYFVVSRLLAGRAKRRSAIIPELAARHCIDCRYSFDILIV
ncbi:hypothetical protein Scep_007411 [Stephania cephalantha]|uniref:Uncharacterized protein n=1 Tax=Stephania cephalantha TaxID=152367 RepID=A0AAP0KBS6_9MAGN